MGISSLSLIRYNVCTSTRVNIQIIIVPFIGVEPPRNWPSRGLVKADGIYVRYAPDTNAVLKDVSFTIQAGQKVRKQQISVIKLIEPQANFLKSSYLIK